MTNSTHARHVRGMLEDIRAGRPINKSGDAQAALEAAANALEGRDDGAYTPNAPQQSAAAQQRDNPGVGATLPDSTLPNPVATQPMMTPSVAAAPPARLSASGRGARTRRRHAVDGDRVVARHRARASIAVTSPHCHQVTLRASPFACGGARTGVRTDGSRQNDRDPFGLAHSVRAHERRHCKLSNLLQRRSAHGPRSRRL